MISLDEFRSIARTPKVEDVLPLICEVQELHKERDKLVDYARVQTDKLHIAMKALENPWLCDVCGTRATEKWGRQCTGSEDCCHWVLNLSQALAEIEAVKK